MKAFVIKNKEGRYFQWFDSITGKNHFSTKPIKFMSFNKEIDAKRMKKHFGLKNCTIVPITIYEGDLEEENRVLKRALELACQKIDEMQPNKPAFICGDYFMEKYNIESRKKTYDADYFIQQAKESE